MADVIQIAFETLGISKTTEEIGSIGTSLDKVGAVSEEVSKKLAGYGAATDDVARTQNQLKQAQLDLVEASNRLAQAQQNLSANTDPGKVAELNKELVNAQVELDNAGRKVQSLTTELVDNDSTVKESAQGFESFSGKLVAIQSGISIAKEAIGGLKQVWDFAKEGAENQRIAESFNRTAKSIGANADDIIGKLDEAARGTVDDEELMQASTRALTLGVAKSGDDLVNVMKLARGAALQFGGDAGTAFENINQAIGNLAPRALKQYGIIVSLKDANEAYAKSIGVSVDSLTEEQQRQALLNEVLIQGAKNFGDIGNAATTTGEKMKAFETRAGNVLDIFKELAASGIGAGFDITDAPKNALEAFAGTADKLRKEVIAGRLSVKDYNDALKGMAATAGQVVPGAFIDAALNAYKLDQSFEASTKGAYSLTGTLDESNRASRRAADEAENLNRQEQQLASIQAEAAAGAGAFSDAYDESARALRRTNEATAETNKSMVLLRAGLSGAVTNELEQYNGKQEDVRKKQAEVKAELDKLISMQGRAVTSTKQATLTDNERAAAIAKLAVLEEDYTSGAHKKNETEAEFASRMANTQVQIDGVKSKLGEATSSVTSYIDNSKKIGELKSTYDELNKELDANAAAHEEATRRILFDIASQQLATIQDPEIRAKAMNDLALQWGLVDRATYDATSKIIEYTDKLAKDQNLAEYEKSIGGVADSIINAIPNALAASDAETAKLHAAPPVLIPAKVDIDPKVTEASLKEAATSHGAPLEIPAVIKPKFDFAEAAGLADKAMAERMGVSAPNVVTRVSADTSQAAKDIQSYTTDKIGAIPKDKKTTAIFDTYKATNDTRNLLNLYGAIPREKQTTVDVDGKLALQTLDDIIRDIGKVISKTVTITVKYAQEGEPTSSAAPPPATHGYAHGGDFIVPSGYPNDNYFIGVSSRERVIVQPNQQAAQTKSGDTYNYTTNVYNPLAAAMLADKQRREKVARSNARMGVS